MKQSKYQIAKKKDLEAQAVILYKQGLSLRAVGKGVGRSYEWVRNVVKPLGDNSVFDKK